MKKTKRVVADSSFKVKLIRSSVLILFLSWFLIASMGITGMIYILSGEDYHIMEVDSISGATVILEEGDSLFGENGSSTLSSAKVTKDDYPLPLFEGQTVMVVSKGDGYAISTMLPKVFFTNAALLIICIVRFMSVRKAQKQNRALYEDLLANGKKLSGRIDNVEKLSKIFRGSRIKVAHTDNMGNTKYFYSVDLVYDPTNFLKDITSVDIYVSHEDEEIYYVDLDGKIPANEVFYTFRPRL